MPTKTVTLRECDHKYYTICNIKMLSVNRVVSGRPNSNCEYSQKINFLRGETKLDQFLTSEKCIQMLLVLDDITWIPTTNKTQVLVSWMNQTNKADKDSITFVSLSQNSHIVNPRINLALKCHKETYDFALLIDTITIYNDCFDV